MTHTETTVSTKTGEVLSASARAGGRGVELAVGDREGGWSRLFALAPARARALAAGPAQAADVADLNRDRSAIQFDSEAEGVIPAGVVR